MGGSAADLTSPDRFRVCWMRCNWLSHLGFQPLYLYGNPGGPLALFRLPTGRFFWVNTATKYPFFYLCVGFVPPVPYTCIQLYINSSPAVANVFFYPNFRSSLSFRGKSLRINTQDRKVAVSVDRRSMRVREKGAAPEPDGECSYTEYSMRCPSQRTRFNPEFRAGACMDCGPSKAWVEP